jgi:hypothetical protein
VCAALTRTPRAPRVVPTALLLALGLSRRQVELSAESVRDDALDHLDEFVVVAGEVSEEPERMCPPAICRWPPALPTSENALSSTWPTWTRESVERALSSTASSMRPKTTQVSTPSTSER